jgi:hypothetical protein
MKLGSTHACTHTLFKDPRYGDMVVNRIQKKFKIETSSSKVLASVFWENGILHVGYPK